MFPVVNGRNFCYIYCIRIIDYDADKYMDWQANRIKQLEEALRQERDRFQPNGWSKAFTEMFETSVKSAVNDSLAKIETACVSALDKFCRQMDPSAYDGQ